VRRLTFLATAFGSLLVSTRADVLINEILVNPPGSNDARQFVELRNTDGAGSATNLWLLQVDGSLTNVGVVDEKWDLSDLRFGANGLLLLGNNYDSTPLGGPWSNLVSSMTESGDPASFGAGDLANSSATWLLVSNCSASVTNSADLDANNDGVVDYPSPWVAVLDSVGWSNSSGGRVYSPASLIQKSGMPDAATRIRNNDTPMSKAAWYNSDILTNATDTLGRTYDAGQASASTPANAVLTPGDLNYPTPGANTNVLISEVYLNPPGSVDERQFVELVNTAGGRADLAGLWLLVVESRGGTIGAISDAWNLTGLRTGTNGLILLGNRYEDPHGGPWSNVVAEGTWAAEPNGPGSSGWGNGDLTDRSDFTLLLTADFSGQAGDDLDTNDDLHLDVAPWSRLADGIGLGQSYAQIIPATNFSPDVVARYSDDARSGTADAWYAGDIAGSNLSLSFSPDKLWQVPAGAALTPGRLNAAAPVDRDGDGIPNTWETQYFGGSTNANPGADPDGDGLDNLAEFVAHTVPTSGLSQFKCVLAATPDDPQAWSVRIDPAYTDRLYDVIWSSNLLDSGWWHEGYDRAGTGGGMSLSVTNASPVRFYRASVRMP
jgi:hypothetical protein